MAFFIVTFGHAVHQCGANASLGAIEATVAASADNSPEPSTQKGIAIDHCHACAMVAVIASSVPELPVFGSERPEVRSCASVTYCRPAENPPPIATI